MNEDLRRYRIGFRPLSYDPKVFSPRIRAVLPCRHLAAAGFRTEIVPPEGDDRFDCVVLQKAYGRPDMDLARRVQKSGGRVVFDLCDNHFYNPGEDPALAERAERLQEIIELADVVSVSTPTIAELVAPKRSVVVDDALEVLAGTDAARRLRGMLVSGRRAARRRRVRLVWHGQLGTENPPSGMIHLRTIMAELEDLNRSLPLSLSVISNSRPGFRTYVGRRPFPTRFFTWRASTFPFLFAAHDVYVLPIELNPFTICKTNNKVVASLLLGVPVVADEIPSYRELAPWVSFGKWSEHIWAYAEDPALATAHVSGGQEYVRRVYTPERVVDQWTAAFRVAFAG